MDGISISISVKGQLIYSHLSMENQKVYISWLRTKYIYLIRQFDVEYGWIFLRVTQYFDEPLGESKYKLTKRYKNR